MIGLLVWAVGATVLLILAVLLMLGAAEHQSGLDKHIIAQDKEIRRERKLRYVQVDEVMVQRRNAEKQAQDAAEAYAAVCVERDKLKRQIDDISRIITPAWSRDSLEQACMESLRDG